MALKQRTLRNAIRATGVGLHTGEKVYLTLRPAAVDTGIVFVRTDLEEPVSLLAHASNVGDTTMATSLTNGSVSISTVEHLMAALAGLGIEVNRRLALADIQRSGHFCGAALGIDFDRSFVLGRDLDRLACTNLTGTDILVFHFALGSSNIR